MKKLILLLFVFSLIPSVDESEGSHLPISKSSRAVQIKVLRDSPLGTTIEFEIKDWTLQPVQIGDKIYSKIFLPNAVTFLKKGFPELPRLSKSVIIPNDAHISYRILESEYETKVIPPVLPSKGNLKRNVNPADVPYTFNKFYKSDNWFPKKTIELHEPFIIRDFRGITIQFNPFQFNPEKEELKICKRIVIEIYPDGPGKTNVKTRHLKPSRSFSDIYRALFLNFSDSRFDTVAETGSMLIITADAYYNNVVPLRNWKRKKGIPTKLVKYSDIGTGRDVIKTYIQNEYDGNGVTFVLLVGDAEDIPPDTGTAGDALNETADPCYTYLAGSDYFPDAFISRFSANNASDVDNQVARSIKYERNPQTSANWCHLGTGIASDESSPTDYERCDWLRDTLLFYSSYTAIDQIYDPGATAGQVKDSLENGRSLVNYIGHGSETKWVTSGFSNSDVGSLMNRDMLPVIISVACVNGQFVGLTCFGESWLRAGGSSNPAGAIAFYGSSIYQSWVPPTIGQMEAVRLLSHNKVNTVGGYMFNGSCGMIEQYLPGNAGVEMFQTWHIFGDCSIQMRTSPPSSISVSHPAAVPVGPYNLGVQVSTGKGAIDGALVCALIDTVLVSDWTDAGGSVTLGIETAQPETVWVTVTGYNLVPYEGYCLSVAGEVYVTYFKHEIIDTGGNGDGIVNAGETIEMPLWVKNYGSDTAYSIEGTFRTIDAFVTITDSTKLFGDIAQGDSAQSEPYVFEVRSDCPDARTVRFELTCKDINDSTWVSNFKIPVRHFSTISGKVLDAGTLNGIAGAIVSYTGPISGADTANINGNYEMRNLSGGAYTLIARADGFFDDSVSVDVPPDTVVDFMLRAPDVSVHPDSLGVALVVGDTTSQLLSISNPGSDTLTFSISESEFLKTVISYSSLVINDRLPERSVLRRKGDNRYFRQTKTDVLRGAGGPDSYGYRWIDSDESGGPTYNWIDITGIGTPITSWTATSSFDADDEGYGGPFALGFNFDFYGTSYDSIYVGANGYIGFSVAGMGTITYMNDSIPTAGAPDGMIAGFWSDMDGGLETSGNGTAYFYTDGTKAIIEYNDWAHYSSSDLETFQIILYPSGVILFQCSSTSQSVGPYQWTMGIENEDGTVGLQVANNNSYIHNDLAVRFSRGVDWLSENPTSGSVPPGGNTNIIVSYDASGLAEDATYKAWLKLNSNDPDEPIISIPVTLNIVTSGDVGPLSIIAPPDTVVVDSTYSPEVWVINFGSDTAKSFNVFCIIDTSGAKYINMGRRKFSLSPSLLYNNTQPVSNLGGGDSILVQFTDWTVPYANKYYLVTVFTVFAGDTVLGNDTLSLLVHELSPGTEEKLLPTRFYVSQNFPNPFFGETEIQCALPKNVHLLITIYDIAGRKIFTLVDADKQAGYHTVKWDSRSSFGDKVASGIYFYKVTAGANKVTRKMFLIR